MYDDLEANVLTLSDNEDIVPGLYLRRWTGKLKIHFNEIEVDKMQTE